MWPLMIVINELPPKLRFTNILLSGLAVCEKEPSNDFMNVFLQQFVEQMKRLETNGILITLHGTSTKIKFKFLPMTSCVDSVARSVMQNRLQFNGYYDCSWCYTQGQYLHGSVRYPISKEVIEYRSHDLHLIDVAAVENTNKKSRSGRERSLRCTENSYF
jgi:hypothetical protein